MKWSTSLPYLLDRLRQYFAMMFFEKADEKVDVRVRIWILAKDSARKQGC
jgi:hypothetical protein